MSGTEIDISFYVGLLFVPRHSSHPPIRGIILNPRAFFHSVFIHFGLSYIYIWRVTDVSWRATRQLDIYKVLPPEKSKVSLDL